MCPESSPCGSCREAAAFPDSPPDSRRVFPSREVSPMVEENAGSVAPEGGGLLIAKRKIAAARTRTEQESDNTSGRSDGND